VGTEITVGPPCLTINHGSTFMVTDRRGEIAPDQELGVFAQDTRFVGYYRWTIERQPWVLLTSSTTSYSEMRLVYTNPAMPALDDPLPGLPQGKGRTFPGVRGNIPANQLGLVLTRDVDGTIAESVVVTNYSDMAVRFHLDLSIRADFVDLFDVKAHRYFSRGDSVSTWHAAEDHWDLVVAYENGDFQRRFTYRVTESDSPPRYENGRIEWTIHIPPAGRWCAEAVMFLDVGQGEGPTPGTSNRREDRLAAWNAHTTRMETSSCTAGSIYRQAAEDMAALRIQVPDVPEPEWVPAAGVPWFVTLFGRDSLIVSYQAISVYAPFARGALKQLAAFQATERDDWRDAQPGKILHELRQGELAHFELIPQTPYYGTADATPLYLILLHEAWKWTGDRKLLDTYLATAERCLQWIDQYGDLDGDGFQEYKTSSPQGYENQSWKDSGVAVVYPDGSQVKQPKALCEMQGYVYDAKLRMAEIYDAVGQTARAEELRHQAAALRQAFNARFWLDELGTYAFGLDPDKHPIATVASNPGHCLWSGIADSDKAARVVQRLLQPDMWSGWGIRTLSARNPSYNPFSYQNGSVWPHDNAIIAAGCKRYGRIEEATRIAEAIFDAAARFESYRLPELYAGVDRADTVFPVQYLGANIPQAWAAGSIFMLVQTMLGLRADAPNGRLYVNPTLPTWLPDVALSNLQVGGARLSVSFWRANNAPDAETRWDVLDCSGAPIEVLAEPPADQSVDLAAG
jgi:glycogen debranching enzyme